jgi:hypothetical protein
MLDSQFLKNEAERLGYDDKPIPLTIDAQLWAEFLKTRNPILDLEVTLTWFKDAITAGRKEGYERGFLEGHLAAQSVNVDGAREEGYAAGYEAGLIEDVLYKSV